MATPPRFVFPSPEPSKVFPSTLASKMEKPRMQLDINPEIRAGYRLAVPDTSFSRPANLRTVTTPPESPTRTRSWTLGSQEPPKMHDSGAITPPATPTRNGHSKSNSASSDFLTALSGLRRGDSTSSKTSRPSLDESARPGSTELLIFAHHLTPYEIHVDAEGRRRPIGSGAWSDVYLAKASPAQLSDQPTGMPLEAVLTPPITPVHSRGSSTGTGTGNLPSISLLYAIKMPASTSAKRVLSAEARILSYLSRYPGAESHVVPFYGQDSRSGALVLKAMDGTLEDWIRKNLSVLDEPHRAQRLADVFPSIALSLIDSLIWMQDKDCIHADIKPSNILFSSSPSSTTPHLVFSDFSSTILPTLSTTDPTPPPLGAGTWEFLDPSLLSSLNPGTPCAATDLWSLGITLLFLILGTSPYEAFKHNKFQQREMIKSGAPLQCLQYDDQGIMNMKILKTLSKDLGFDVVTWLAKVLVKNKDKRASVRQWRAQLVDAVALHGARM